MRDNVESATHEIPKSMHASIAELNAKIDALDAGMGKDRRNVAGMLVMMRAVAGDFEERVTDVVDRVSALESTAG